MGLDNMGLDFEQNIARTALVVEDHPDLRKMVETVLISEGFEVITAANADEALKHAEQRPFSLLLSDNRMPEKGDGLRLIRTISKFPTAFYTKIVLMSGTLNEDLSNSDKAEFQKNGWGMIVKPFNIDDLLVLVTAKKV